MTQSMNEEMSSPASLSCQGLTKRYGDRQILADCSLTVAPGQCVLLRGPSGGGKSTLLRILALLEDADLGRVSHGSQHWDAGLVPPTISAYPFLTVVFQQLFLWPNLTLAQNIALALDHDPYRPLRPPVLEALERFSIRHLVNHLPHQCSLGERQRLALVRALASDARFLLLDEPSSALDRVNRDVLVDELKTARRNDRGLLLITHDDRTFEDFADASLLLENGRLQPQ